MEKKSEVSQTAEVTKVKGYDIRGKVEMECKSWDGNKYGCQGYGQGCDPLYQSVHLEHIAD